MFKSITPLLFLLSAHTVGLGQSNEDDSRLGYYKNPSSLVRFVEKGYYYTSRMNPNNQGQSVRASSVIRIEFEKIPSEYHDEVELIITAYVKTVDDNIVPIDIPGFMAVESTKLDELNASGAGTDETIETRVAYSARKYIDLVPTEIDLKSISKLKEGDQIVFDVKNTRANNVSHSMTFVIDDFGWKGEAASGPVWVKTYNSEAVNFTTSPFAGYSFHYRTRVNGRFIWKFLIPSFGPSAVMVDDGGSKFGLGIQVSALARTVSFGSGYFLNQSGSRSQREYYYIGVNFLEGIDAFKEMLSTGAAD